MQRLALACLAALLLAGCAGDAPDATATDHGDDRQSLASEAKQDSLASVDKTKPLVETVRTFSGTQLLRAGGDEPPFGFEDGDSPSFCFDLPPPVARVRAELRFSPRQQVGLELWNDAGRVARTWDETQPPTMIPESPLRLEADAGPGDWFVYGGLGSFGAGLDWELDLAMSTYGEPAPADVAAFEAIDSAC